jgi:hypothetical protein
VRWRKKNATPELSLEAHRFSNEAFALAKALAAGEGDFDDLKAQASQLRERVPEIAARMESVPEEYRPDINQALGDARLDLDYVRAGGDVAATSTRLHHFMAER